MVLPYIIFELQSDSAGNVSVLPPVIKQTENEAWGEFYLKLAYAAVSSVVIHTVMLVTVDGRLISTKTFLHMEPPEVEE